MEHLQGGLTQEGRWCILPLLPGNAGRMTSKQLADLLKRIRLQAGHDHAEMALRMQVNTVTVARLEDGEREPTLDTLRAWGEACGQALDLTFLAGSDTQGDDPVLSDLILGYQKLSAADRTLLRDLAACLGKVTPRWRDVISSQVDLLLGRTQQVQMPILLAAGAEPHLPHTPGFDDTDIAHRLRTRTPAPAREVTRESLEDPDTDEDGILAPLADLWTGARARWRRIHAWWARNRAGR